jgi:undecaprenol kinase
MFDVRKFFKSFKFAFRGIKHAFKFEQNFRVHIVVAVLVLFFGWYFRVPLWQWVVLMFVIFGVIIAELANTIFEKIVDVLEPRVHPYAKVMKDMMAGIVLLSAVLAVIVGIMIFGDEVLNLFR